MLESDWLTNILRCAIIFRETHGECSSRQLSWPHYMTTSLHQIISVITKKINKTHNDTGQTNKYSKQKDKINSSCSCFATKLHFIMYVKHIA